MQYTKVKELAYHFCILFREQREETKRKISESLKIFTSDMTTDEKMEAYKLAVSQGDKDLASWYDIETHEDKYNWKDTL